MVASSTSRVPRSLPRCEPVALCEALVAVTSGVLLWMGLWDLIEEVVPAVWYAKMLMIIIGGSGLYLMRQLYHGQQLQASMRTTLVLRRGAPAPRRTLSAALSLLVGVQR